MAARIPIDAVRSLLAVLGVVSIHAPADAQGIGGDPSRGERVFQRCYACHSVDPAETALEGPNLDGVVGRKAAALSGFDYSDAMIAQARRGLVWTEAALDAFLADPQGVVPGNEMGFFGLADARDRADLVAYLRQQTGRPTQSRHSPPRHVPSRRSGHDSKEGGRAWIRRS